MYKKNKGSYSIGQGQLENIQILFLFYYIRDGSGRGINMCWGSYYIMTIGGDITVFLSWGVGGCRRCAYAHIA